MSKQQDVTVLLDKISEGSSTAPSELLPLVYDDLRRLAQAYFNNEKSEHTLQATALVHEAYIRLVNWENVSWQNRAHFFAVAAEVMRKVLIDHARKRDSQKRSGGQRIVLDDAISVPEKKDLDVIKLEEALVALETVDPRQAKIVELRFFGGLSIEETAYVLNISETTVRREWTFAKAWFQRELTS
ncbi:MAG TPA: sigma-70 family RNA polymerase sigma factor [Pyrinomonadaceae bacterium]|nr:sigma-70 family RNA polymerase sigma factor [Pyrinomonadaceae bacterium]